MEDVTATTEVIAVVMPNIDCVRSDDWEQYRSTVDRIEYSTGYDFLSSLPNEIQAILESKN